MLTDTKIIFLDIDGVLNCEDWYKQRHSRSTKDSDKSHFSPDLVRNLNQITTKTGAKIVLTSSWRKNRTLGELKDLFVSVGITGDLIDKTEVLYFSNWNYSVPRGCEIEHWIQTHRKFPWRSYVIIDDDADMLFTHRNNVFLTDPSGGGLTTNLSYRIINFLKSLV